MTPLRVALAGLGTVGAGTFRLLRDQAALLGARAGREIVVTDVSARSRTRERGIDLAGIAWHDDPARMAASADVDVVVELIGGAEGAARATVQAALARGKAVVTANKALLAAHGAELAAMAEERPGAGPLAWEAAVAGGIPVVKALREGLAGNRVEAVYGILNGTCNFILSTMRETGRAFADVLREAQESGYAEADPSFDIDGVDAAHKLALLTAVAFGTRPSIEALHIEGIRQISSLDIAYAEEFGYRIKLLGIARRTPVGIEQSVQPCMVRLDAPIARVEGVFNAVVVVGDAVGRVVLEGRGAGAGPTASAVVADLVDIAAGRRAPTFGVPAAALAPLEAAPSHRHVGPYYLRLMVRDQPGVIAAIATELGRERVSIESVLQRGRDPALTVPVVMVTHETEEAALRRALGRIAALETVTEPPCMIRIASL